ncbi:MAG: hypothetical protein P0119_19075 [Nitrospira sp.]|nr:hypothetical protein [Nitrospira sp.]
MHFITANEFIAPGKRTAISDTFKVELDLSTQVLAIQAPEEQDFWGSFGSDEVQQRAETRLYPILDLNTICPTAPMSAAVLAQKSKIFDEGLFAAIEVAVQDGGGRHAGKAALIASLGRVLAGADPSVAGTAQDVLLGAARLGHIPVTDVPPAVEANARHAVELFLADEMRSKPISFYSWSRQLENIYQQDRLLQSGMNITGIKTLANALHADQSARAIYERHLRLISSLTNPFAHPDLRSLLDAYDRGETGRIQQDMRFFPPSVAHETTLMKKLFGVNPIPEGFILADEMIRRIRSHQLNLEPNTESGWYDYQTWSLEPLVVPDLMPEAKRLQLDDQYRGLLLELFKGLLTLTRETHIKQLEQASFGATMGREKYIRIDPVLSAEPLATFYLRRAIGYRYIRRVLEDTFGPSELEHLHRLTEAGPVSTPLAEELAGIETLFLGAHTSVCGELGLTPDAAIGSDAAARDAADRFAYWAIRVESDPDLRLDLRAMVPVFYDIERHRLKVWTFLGWARRPITVTFARPPQASVRNLNGALLPNHPSIRWGGLHADLPYPVTAELYVDRILDRAEFRKLCDSCGTKQEILRHLDVSANPA